jgi:hypothetical protein
MTVEGPATPARPNFSLREAADVCGVSKITMRRRLDARGFPNAWRANGPGGQATGEWRIPIEDLLAAGFTPNAALNGPLRPPGPPTTPNGSQAASAPLSPTPNAPQPGQLDLQKEVDRLRADLLAETHRRELAETLAAEQGRHLADLRTALNMLNPARRKRWFRRS